MTPGARPPTDWASRRVEEHLPYDETAPRRARAVVRDTLTRWQLVDLVPDAELAISELVTNALKHGLPPVVLEIRHATTDLRIAVSDGRPPSGQHEDQVVSRDDDESGRGQGIIEGVSDRSGVDIAPTGKSIYAAWDATSPDAAQP